ncbi:hypothetical protein [Mycobacteroides abscessus]|uniref:hypothetical protein n=1 Tax=Mycobacteroides abscessus TaxID=36809 RepID=UPI00092C4553|nr:hypothetical protein [Mycobacteroides abscessus]SIA36717.1 Uncharacterised protein [Mycobacteroides abscessus subsp. abscessus]SIA40593.1 Uncharacterised protein [Mycobacteroides abscessus subsp. abscessus]SIA52408.1 Uncharacterised protein [Mycobacteroides abscessus subsp. abscessus]SIA56541.1 Uncharacterised protein [Mycobacteroides abscessus subsp. abscessus]SIA82003.1 Uncharacterised protein [Mycobacteroides abscessus subsp. abscessus]
MDKPGWKQVLQHINDGTEAPATNLPWRPRGDENGTASTDSEDLKPLYARLATPAPRPESSNYVPGEGNNPRPPKHPRQGTLDFLREATTGEIAQTIY